MAEVGTIGRLTIPSGVTVSVGLRPNSQAGGMRSSILRYGSAVPDFDLTVEMSELLITPLTVTSVRKFVAFAAVPLD
jgi:hypothetical protein